MKEKDGAASGIEGPPGESGQEAESSSEPVVTGSDAAEKQEAGRGWRAGKCGACWALGSHRALTWRAELGRQTPGRIRKAGVR